MPHKSINILFYFYDITHNVNVPSNDNILFIGSISMQLTCMHLKKYTTTN